MEAQRTIRRVIALAGVSLGLLGVGACGSSDSGGPAVGDCIDGENQIVDCSSSSAAKTLVSDQSTEDAIACVVIGDKPQTEVEVEDKTFCAEDR